MGREIKRVPMGFDWPMGRVWLGYLNPHYGACHACPQCEGTGYNEATKRIADDWYDFAGTGRKWCHKLLQDEVDALVEKERLWDFTRTWTPDEGWKPKDPPCCPTAAEVNEWSQRGMGHDALNRMICVEARSRRLGVYGHCERCNGEGETWDAPEDKTAAERWEEEEPPSGDGHQLWETVSAGSPVSPVFATPEELARWLVEPGNDDSITSGTTYEQWMRFIDAGWAPSLVSVADSGLVPGVQAALTRKD